MNFDPKLVQEVTSTAQSVTNGEALDMMQELYKVFHEAGEGSDVTETPCRSLQEFADNYNSVVVPALQKCMNNFASLEEFAVFMNQVQGNDVKSDSEVGAIEDANYDAAKNL